MLATTKIKSLHPTFIFLLAQLLIEHVVLLLPQSRTAEAITAAAAIEEKCRIPALFTELLVTKLETAI